MSYVQHYILKRCQRYHANQLTDARRERDVLIAFNALPQWPQALWSKK